MSLQHLHSWSQAAAPSGARDAVNLTGGTTPKAGKAMKTVPAVSGYSKEALHAMGASAKPHPHGGARAGAKSGQPKLGETKKSLLGKVHPLESGGRAGRA